MVSQSRPVRPEPANFEVFVDTCLRIAAEQDVPLPVGLGDRQAWDEAYRRLRDHTDRHPRPPAPTRSCPPVEPPGSEYEPAQVSVSAPAPAGAVPAGAEAAPRGPLVTRRRIILATPLALAGVAVPLLIRQFGGPAKSGAEASPDNASGDQGYDPAGSLLCPPISPDNPTWSVAFGALHGEPVVIVGRGDGTVQLWDPLTRTARGIPLKHHDKPVFSVGLSSPIAVSASVDGTLRVWDLTADPPASTQLGDRLGGGINGVALGRVRGATVAVSSSDDHTVRVWHPASPSTTGTVLGERLDTEITSVATSTLHGTTIAVTGGADGAVRLWDVEAERAVQVLGTHEAAVWAMAVGAIGDRTVAVSGSDDGEFRSWDLTAPKPGGHTLNRFRVAVKSAAVGVLNGRTVAISGSDDNQIRIWDLATGQPYGEGLTGPDKGAMSIAMGDIGGRTFVVSGHWDGTIWTWLL
ncbi:WD40 repeat domain-containing protein [Plantactinospora soyae]|uniref:WD40 repeat domain-containing protein n=1 Tax=Plantactinospora soyae TaxID=1544732 RepID=A0A927R7M5_9ACTN|nr:WD40 repeat domain-containing protein [Plantactinospora soyae]MBE1489599.1 hypothetical protein [Plantactinospora soyae]